MLLTSLFTGHSEKRPFLLEWRCAKSFIIFVVAMSIFTDIFLYAVIVPVIPFALHERAGIADDQRQYWVSILLAVYGAALLVASPFLGWASDRITARRIPYLFGLIALAGSTLFLCLGNSITLLIIGRLLQGLSAAIVWVVGLALLVDTVGKGEAVGEAMGYVGIALSLGLLIAPVLGGIVFSKAGYNAVFYMCFGLLGLDVLCRLVMIERKVAKIWIPQLASRRPSMLSLRPSSSQLATDSEKAEVKQRSSGLAAFNDSIEKSSELTSGHLNNSPKPHDSDDDQNQILPGKKPIANGNDRPGQKSNTSPFACVNQNSTLAIIDNSGPTVEHSSHLSASGITPSITPYRRTRLPPVITLLASRRMLAAVWASFIQATVFTAFDSSLPLRVRAIFGWTSLGSGLLFLAVAVPSFFSPIIGMFSDRYGPKWFVASGFLLAVPFLVLLRLVDHDSFSQKAIMVVLLAGLGISINFALTPVMADFTYCVESKEAKAPEGAFGANGAYAQAYALFNMAFALGCLVGPIWGGMIKEAAGWGTMCWTLGLLSGVSIIPAILFTGGWIADKNKWQPKGNNTNASDEFESFDEDSQTAAERELPRLKQDEIDALGSHEPTETPIRASSTMNGDTIHDLKFHQTLWRRHAEPASMDDFDL